MIQCKHNDTSYLYQTGCPKAIRHASVSIMTAFVSVALNLVNHSRVFTDQPSDPTGPHGRLGHDASTLYLLRLAQGP